MRYYIFNTEKEAREVSLRVYTNGIDWVAEVPAYVHVDELITEFGCFQARQPT